MDKILIHDLRCTAIIGVLAHERKIAQPVSMDLEFELDCAPAARSGDLNLSLDYALASKVCIDFVKARKAYLVEELAYDLADYLLQRFNLIASVKLKLMKLNAVAEAAGVGIEIFRTRSASKA